jgi:2-polyprenyl-6-methoxyphenol hydroxylase-like FAD-dependent oxidoreductase
MCSSFTVKLNQQRRTMENRTAVVSGASIAGLSTAYWLRRTGWDVTVIERATAFRDGGQNVDVRGVARDVVRRMGLFDAVKARNTTETGTVLVDGRGVVTAELPSDGVGGSTAELEILRGDLARVVLDALPAGVTFVYGDTVSAVEDDADGVTLTTEGGRRLRADLFVIAEGVRSRTRGMVFGEDAVEQRDLDVTMVFGTTTAGAGTTPSADARSTSGPTRTARSARSSPTRPGTTSCG